MAETQTQEEIQLNNDKRLVFYARRDVFHHHPDNRELKIELIITKNLAFGSLKIEYSEGAGYVDGYYSKYVHAYFDYDKREIYFNASKASTSLPYSGETELKISEKTDIEPPFVWEEEFLQSDEYFEKWKNNSISVEDAKKILSEIIDYFLYDNNDDKAIISLSAIADIIKEALDESYDNISVRVEDL